MPASPTLTTKTTLRCIANCYCGFTSISVTPDTAVAVRLAVHAAEQDQRILIGAYELEAGE
jgi:hypothetical protein